MQLLKRMLSFEAEDRPSFVELREILRYSQLALNLNNEAFVEGIFKEKMSKGAMKLTEM